MSPISGYRRSQKPGRRSAAAGKSFFANRYVRVTLGLAVLTAIALVFFLVRGSPSPVPTDIKTQVTFNIFYPTGDFVISPNSWKYVPKTKTLTFVANEGNSSVTLTEQPTPLAYADDQAAYQRFIGGLKPSANFDSPNGSVSITSFVTAGDFQDVGKTAILNAQGTLVLAHPSGNFSDEQWRALFQSLKISG